MSHLRNCPYCAKETLGFFERTPTYDTLACKECKALFTVKTTWGIAQEFILVWLSLISGLIALIAFFGIRCFDDLKKCPFF